MLESLPDLCSRLLSVMAVTIMDVKFRLTSLPYEKRPPLAIFFILDEFNLVVLKIEIMRELPVVTNRDHHYILAL